MATYIPAPTALDPIGVALGESLGNAIAQGVQSKRLKDDQDAMLAWLQQQQGAQSPMGQVGSMASSWLDEPANFDPNAAQNQQPVAPTPSAPMPMNAALPRLRTPEMRKMLFDMVLGQTVMDPLKQAQIAGIGAQAERDRAEAMAVLNPPPKMYEPQVLVNDAGEQIIWTPGQSLPDPTGGSWKRMGTSSEPTRDKLIAVEMQKLETRMQALRESGIPEDSPAMQATQKRWDELAKTGMSVNIDNRPMTEGMIQRQSSREATIQAAHDALGKWNPKWTGPLQGRWTSFKNKWIGGSRPAAEFEAATTTILQSMYERAGKQLSDIELAKWKPFLPQLSDPDTTFTGKMNNVIQNVATYLEKESQLSERMGYRPSESGSPNKTQEQKTRTVGDVTYLYIGNGQWEAQE